MNGINESAVFKNPSKLPAILYFTKNEKGENEVKVLENIEEILTRKANEEDIKKRIEEFIKKQAK